jgi:hypothetical protein
VQPNDRPRIVERIEDTNAELVVIDPISAFMDAEIDPHKDASVRRMMSRLPTVAQRTGAAFLRVRHLGTSRGKATHDRGGARVGISGAARSVCLAAKHPRDPERRVLASVKCNRVRSPKSLLFRGVSADAGPAMVWEGPAGLSADDLVSDRNKPDKGNRSCCLVLQPRLT